ncbi:MBL fold metallo-hydrolase [Novosphingobium sp.]|uniref:MBL fold metallo-hydrolase n=1 Tax=Novosphingobium sp. TaxID=1874826 RepID=UPI0025F4FF1C|nr:MBL fold metallo-hydrolase [Novosphingobium sp.]MCC6925771.1 MBL fold metallo-hydrolase [Novosphingobium sp.]
MKRKVAVIGSLLAILVGLALVLGRGAIAERAFQSALDKNVGVDQSAKLGDGLHAYVCGSGSPMPDTDRAGPCIAVLAGNQGFIFDSGSGSVRKLGRMGFPMGKLQAEFLTHLHSDHIDGLGEALLQAWIAGSRGAPLPVYGPEGTDKVVAGFNAAYALDQGYRVAHHGPKVANPAGAGGAAQVIALPDGVDSQVVWDQQGVKITVIRVNHAPISPAFGYRVDYKGRSLSISGDTVYSPAFVTASKGVDLMFHEALNKQMIAAMGKKLGERGQANTAQIMTDIQNYHASPEDAARSAKEAGVQALVLYHLVPPVPATLIEPLFLGNAPKQFGGTLKLGHDGMIVSLPAGGKQVKFSDAW